MSDANENITNQPDDELRGDAITSEPPLSAYVYEPGQVASPLPKSRLWLFVLLSVGTLALLVLVIGLVITSVAKTRAAADQRRTVDQHLKADVARNATTSPTTR